MNSEEKLARTMTSDFLEKTWSARESWRVFGIMAEFVEATERLNSIRPAVSIFGSARTSPDHPNYKLTEQIARLLSDAGFSVISGGGPGIMEAANKGAYFGTSPSVGLNIQLPHEQHTNPYQNISQTFHHFFTRKVMFVKFASAYVVM
ncbi:MAG TPA: LOG family protein, partial [Nitrosospira sp.]